MNLDFPAAMNPFLTATVTVLASGVSGADPADAVRVAAASVRAGSPEGSSGSAAAGEQWVVSFREADWISARRLSKGCAVAADTLSGRWPRLTVQRVQRLAGMFVLECSAREKGKPA